jgi:hypothetical protein
MSMSEMASRGKPELGRIPIGMSGVELSETMSSIRPGAHERAKGNGLWGNVGENIKRVSGNGIREVRDHGNAVPGIGSLVCRGVNWWDSVRKSRGRFRT